MPTTEKICFVNGCSQSRVRRLYCHKHYMRLRRHGTLDDPAPQLSEAYQQPFWDRLNKTANCWEWTQGTDKDGYGVTSFNAWPVKAHRLAYYFTYGEFPSLVRHTCDNPPCCNPAHLIKGTAADNARDKVLRGRQPRGEQSGIAKLTERQVRQIRERGVLYPRGMGKGSVNSQKALAKDFGVNRRTIGLILRGYIWRHV